MTIVWPGRQRPSRGPNLVLIGFGSLDVASLDAETTPTLEALAREGVFFDQALVSTTDPSTGHAVWLSGLEPHRLRASGGPEGGSEGEPVESLLQRLTKAGYRSASMGDARLADRFAGLTTDPPTLERWPLALEPLRLFAASLAPHLGLDPPARRDADAASESVDRALRFVDAGTKPFALALFLPEARPPFAGACPRALAFTDPSYRGRCKYRTCDAAPGAPPRDDDDRRQELALRRGALACDDAALGRLLEGLRARGLEETTLVA
ncbi:MAG: sulfatase-like hydrolase/transferase, partial [Polyangiaceae bacterium]|nr:sulfatase-like hydrolase/transferase [Polyangiaceae bacterium]